MTITIKVEKLFIAESEESCVADEAAEYLEFVASKIREGYTMGEGWTLD